MIRFINNNGETFDGVNPYIHWLNGQCSTGIWYTIKLMFISDSASISTSSLDSNSIFKFVKPEYYTPSTTSLDLDTITTKNAITVNGYSITVSGATKYIYQILLVCESDAVGEYIETFKIDGNDVSVGIDLYGEDETLTINLSNRGTEIPNYIQKTFLDIDLEEDNIDYSIINRKFKELISNYIDITDNRGSYKSLYNSLQWFEWGDNVKLYEIWKNDEGYFEKNLELMLSDFYKELLVTHTKTTHLALVAAIQKFSTGDIITDQTNPLYDDRNPVIENISYGLSNDELAVKVSLLGLFFERYFMPIHLDLKRACIEALVCTNQIKVLNGALEDKYHYFEDTGVINLEMEHVVTIGNIEPVAVGINTVFGKRFNTEDLPSYDPNVERPRYTEPIGVDYLRNINNIVIPDEGEGLRDFNDDYNDDFGPPESSSTAPSYGAAPRSTSTFFSQIAGGIGVVVPVTVSLDLPVDDAICTEIITTFRYRNGSTTPITDQTTDRRLYRPSNGKVSFSFNLLSKQEEKVSFTIELISLSGHTWTVSSSYECIDTRGGLLRIYKVTNTDNSGSGAKFTTISQWLANDDFVPYSAQFDLYQDQSNPITPKIITQYLPFEDNASSQFNQIILIQSNVASESSGSYDESFDESFDSDIVYTYNSSWMTNPLITNDFWVIPRSTNPNPNDPTVVLNQKYGILISKQPGKYIASKAAFVNKYGSLGLTTQNIKRMSLSYVPQLHEYTDIENSNSISESSYTFDSKNLLCVVPEFRDTIKRNIDVNSIYWEFTNMTNFEKIRMNLPVQVPLASHNQNESLLSSGYWSVAMYYKLIGSSEVHKMSRNSAFKII